MVVIPKKKTDCLVFEKNCFLEEKFLRIPPLQTDDENFVRIPPPSKPQNRFEGGVSLALPPDCTRKLLLVSLPIRILRI